MKADKKISLRNFISREFFKAALLPLLVVGVTLLALYFFMNAYLLDKSIDTLRADRYSHLMYITETQSQIIGEQLHAISDLSLVLQTQTCRFYNHPEQFPIPPTATKFGFAPNGVYYKRDDNGGCSLYYSGLNAVGAKEKEKALRSESLDPFFQEISSANKNIVAVYLNTFDSMSRYYPFFENVYEQLPSDMNIPEYNFYYLADETHNPGGGPVWTAAYLDPMGMGWMMSCVVPIYNDRFLEGVSGIDITIKNFIDNLLALQLPWGSHAFLVDAQGTIMAMPPEVERIFGIAELYAYIYEDKVEQDTPKPESFNLLGSVLASVRRPVTELMQEKNGSIELYLDERRYVLCQNTVLATGWKLMVIADLATILSPISKLEQHAGRVGYAAIGVMFLFFIPFFFYLINNTRRMSERIAQVISGLSNAIQRLGTGVYKTRITSSPVMELDILSTNFESMALDLKMLHENLERQILQANMAEEAAKQAQGRLQEHKMHLERTVKERTAKLATTNRQLQADIIKRKRVEGKLDRERRQLLSIFDSIDEPIYISTADTYELLYVNEAVKKYLPDPLSQKCYEVMQKRNTPCPFCTNDIIFGEKRGQTYIWEHYNIACERWFRCIDKAIRWPDGRMVRYEMAIDITEQKSAFKDKQRLMERLQRAEKMEALGTLAGGVAHDLNNILGAIVGYPDLLLMDMAADNPLRQPIQTIQTSGQRATAVVQDLLTLARRGVSVMGATNLNDIVAETVASPECHRLMQLHPDVYLKTHFAKELLNCMGSSVHLSTMVMNLIANAAEAMPNGGDIFISTATQYVDRPLKGYDEVQEGEYVVLRITDVGTGILPEDLERIFEPFYTKKKMGRSGTGLGMAVVWGTVKDHRGYIELQSSADSGTKIEIYLPATREKPAGERPQPSLGEIRGNQEMILVVDDVAFQRKIAVDMLKSLGYKAHAVSSGESAVAYLTDHCVDLVLLDMIMEPNIDGLETYRRIIKIHPGQKAIIVSGFSETEAIREVQRIGAGEYVKKPYTIHELGHVLKEALNPK